MENVHWPEIRIYIQKLEWERMSDSKSPKNLNEKKNVNEEEDVWSTSLSLTKQVNNPFIIMFPKELSTLFVV